jgi:hypothetical protein
LFPVISLDQIHSGLRFGIRAMQFYNAPPEYSRPQSRGWRWRIGGGCNQSTIAHAQVPTQGVTNRCKHQFILFEWCLFQQ